MSGARLVPPGARERFVEAGAGRVRLLEATATPPDGRRPLLLVHGGGSDNAAISWYGMFDAYGAHRPVHALDLPGFGHTEVAAVGGPEAMADVVAELARELGLDRAVVVGVSMGGDVAMNLALRHPDLVAALVLIGSGGLVPIFRGRVAHGLAWLSTRLPDVLLDALARLSNRYAERLLRATVVDLDTLPRPAVEEFLAEARRRPTSPGYRDYNRAALGPTGMRNDLLPVVARIPVPTLLVHGADDPIVDPAGSREAARRMPDARLVEIPDCGHWAQLECPERFRYELDAFLAAL